MPPKKKPVAAPPAQEAPVDTPPLSFKELAERIETWGAANNFTAQEVLDVLNFGLDVRRIAVAQEAARARRMKL